MCKFPKKGKVFVHGNQLTSKQPFCNFYFYSYDINYEKKILWACLYILQWSKFQQIFPFNPIQKKPLTTDNARLTTDNSSLKYLAEEQIEIN